MTLKAGGRVKPDKSDKPRKKVKCPYCHDSFKVTEESFEVVMGILHYYCESCGEIFTEKQI